MAYLVIAYPELAAADLEMIQAHRREHDAYYHSIVEPHFTIVFPVHGQMPEDFIKEIKELSKDVQKVDFSIRCATVNKDAFSDSFYTFLVPDEGYSHLVKLHDRLYSGLLAPELRLDIDFIPHIGIGTSPDKYLCQKMASSWNAKELTISGSVSRLSIVEYKDNKVTDMGSIGLK